MREVAAAVTLALGLCSGCSSGPGPEEERNAPGIDASAANLPAPVSPFPKGFTGTLVFESDREGRPKIYTIALETGTITRLTSGPGWRDEKPVWSPDGRQIAFVSTREGNYDIYVMQADGTGVRRLTDHAAIEHDPSWAPDGRSIIFTGERDGRGELYRVWLDSARVDRITSGFNRAIMPAVSPDGAQVAYAGQTIRWFQIHTTPIAGSDAGAQLTSGDPACRPAWSPDGRTLAYVVGENPSRIGALDLASRQVRTLFSHERLWSYYPAYSPDGRWLAFGVSPEHHDGQDWDLAILSTADPARTFQRLTIGPGNDRLPDWKPVRR
jgi:Tol biopolymer transport system component